MKIKKKSSSIVFTSSNRLFQMRIIRKSSFIDTKVKFNVVQGLEVFLGLRPVQFFFFSIKNLKLIVRPVPVYVHRNNFFDSFRSCIQLGQWGNWTDLIYEQVLTELLHLPRLSLKWYQPIGKIHFPFPCRWKDNLTWLLFHFCCFFCWLFF